MAKWPLNYDIGWPFSGFGQPLLVMVAWVRVISTPSPQCEMKSSLSISVEGMHSCRGKIEQLTIGQMADHGQYCMAILAK